MDDLSLLFTIADVPATRVVRYRRIADVSLGGALVVECVFPESIPLPDLVGQPARMLATVPGLLPPAATRWFHGIVERATLIATPQRESTLFGVEGTRFEIRVVPRVGLLARSFSSEIFQEKSVVDIVKQVFSDHGLTRVDSRVTVSYPPRTYCVRYEEDALSFVRRLMEKEGIHAFVEHDEEGETIVLADKSSSAEDIVGGATITYRPRSKLDEVEGAVYLLASRAEVRPGKHVLRDYDFERPSADLTSTAEADAWTELERYDFPGGYTNEDDGARYARVLLEADQARRNTLRLDADSPRLGAGRKLTLVGSDADDGDWFVHAVDETYQAATADAGATFVARAFATPFDVPFRLVRVTPEPRIHGPQSATVVAPEGADVEAICADKHGRCKVKFHWDRTDVNDDRASCFMRVEQLQTSGSMMLPRLGWEVLVEFTEGDPDRPVIVGRLYNGVYMPPYALPEGKTRTAIKSFSSPGGKGTSEVRFEDKAGSEEIMLLAQKDKRVVVANDAKKTVGNNQTVVVKNNAESEVGGNQTTRITKGAEHTVGADQTATISGNRKLEVNAVRGINVGGNATFEVGGNQFEMNGNPLEALLALAAQKAQELATAMADNAVATIQGQVDGAVNQALGPIDRLGGQLDGIASGMNAVKNGDLGAIAPMVADASRIPGAGQLASAMGGGSQGAQGQGPGGAVSAIAHGAANNAMNQGAAAATGAAHAGIAQGVGAAHSALAKALGVDAAGSGGASGDNAGGPAGDVPGIDATDREKGPGHTTAKITGTLTETVGALKVAASLQAVNTDVAGSLTRKVGAANVQLSVGANTAQVAGSKTESQLGLVVLSKAGEAETVGGSKTTMVGGAIVDQMGGSHMVVAGGPATFIGAFHKVEAQGTITFKCGGTELVLAGGGVTIQSPMVICLAPKIHMPKKVTEV